MRREFSVELTAEKAWEHLAQVERWPKWAKHIRSVTVDPPGPVEPTSTGVLHLRNGIKSAFKMTAFDPPRSWTWTGPVLWLTIRYDHAFEPVTPDRTKLTWIVEGEGFGTSVFGRLFAAAYNRQLDRAIPALMDEMNRAAKG